MNTTMKKLLLKFFTCVVIVMCLCLRHFLVEMDFLCVTAKWFPFDDYLVQSYCLTKTPLMAKRRGIKTNIEVKLCALTFEILVASTCYFIITNR